MHACGYKISAGKCMTCGYKRRVCSYKCMACAVINAWHGLYYMTFWLCSSLIEQKWGSIGWQNALMYCVLCVHIPCSCGRFSYSIIIGKTVRRLETNTIVYVAIFSPSFVIHMQWLLSLVSVMDFLFTSCHVPCSCTGNGHHLYLLLEPHFCFSVFNFTR